MKNLWILLFIPFLWAGDYVCHQNGVITEKYMSVDGYSQKQRPECLKVTRKVFESLTRWKKIENGKIVEMTQVEKDALDAPTQNEIDSKAVVENLKIKLKTQGYTSEEISILISNI